MFLVVQQVMRRIARSSVCSWLLLATVVGLFGCPLLLDDDFSIGALSTPDAGDPCIGATCHVPYSNIGGSSGEGDGGEPGGSAGVAGTSAGNGGAGGSSSSAGSTGIAGASGSAGSGSSGGSAGVSGNAGSGSAGTGSAGTGSAGAGSAGTGSAGEGGGELACRTLELTDGTHDSASNCLGIAGSNIVVKDTGTSLTLSYEDGDPCFSGTIASNGWGATYELGFAPGTSTWDAQDAGVTGFEFAYRGTSQPASLRVYYKDTSGVDNCRVLGSGTTAVPFSAAHPNCSTSSSSPVVDSTEMDEMILAFIPTGTAYPVNFCIRIRALD